MFCSRCGSQNVDSASFCEKCGTPFAAQSSAPSGFPQPGGTLREGPPRQFAVGKNPAVAAVLSLVVPTFAIGQFYNGDVKKGAVMLICSLIAIPLWAAAGIGSVLNFGIWIWSVIDAYRVASGKAPLW